MKKVEQGVTVSRTMGVSEKVVSVHHVTESKKHGHCELDMQFDFTEVTEPELLKLATATMVIRIRPEFKKDSGSWDDVESKFDGRVYDVRKYLDTARKQRKSVAEKADDLLTKMSPKEKAAWIEKLTA